MSVVKSSVIPSAKYSCSASLLRLLNGSTTIDSRGAEYGGNVRRAAGVAVSRCAFGTSCRADHCHQALPARATSSNPATAGPRTRERIADHLVPVAAADAHPFDLVPTVYARPGSAL